MDAEVDKDDGTFTNISLADDPGEAAIRFYSLISLNQLHQLPTTRFATDLQLSPKCS